MSFLVTDFFPLFAVVPDDPPLVPDNELVREDINDNDPLSSIPEPDDPPWASGRQRAVAQVHLLEGKDCVLQPQDCVLQPREDRWSRDM